MSFARRRLLAAALGMFGCASPVSPSVPPAAAGPERGSRSSARPSPGAGVEASPDQSERGSEPLTPPEPKQREPSPPLESYDADADADGVPDARDRCPDTPGAELPDSMQSGCPARRRSIVLPPSEIEFHARIQFESGKSSLPAQSSSVLDELASVLAGHDEIELEIIGHTDSTEPEDLALMRARTVRNALVARGISPSRVSLSGQGSRNPNATNSTAAGRAQNRRVEFSRRGPRTPLDR